MVSKYAPKGKSIPVISGEWGYSASAMPPLRQAQYLARQFLTNLMSNVPLSIWYDWRNDGPDPKEPEHNFGTTNLDGSPKPAYIAAQTLTSELAGCRFAKRLFAKSEKDFVLLFQGPKGYRVAAWTLGDDHTIDIPLDSPVATCVSMLGERSKIDVVGGKARVSVSQSPCYVEVGHS